MRIAAIVVALSPLVACTPVEMRSHVVARVAEGAQVLVQTTDELAPLTPGDVVRIWHGRCRGASGCGPSCVGNGVVAVVLADRADYAFVDVLPGCVIAVGDRVTKDSLMSYWHPGQMD